MIIYLGRKYRCTFLRSKHGLGTSVSELASEAVRNRDQYPRPGGGDHHRWNWRVLDSA